MSAAKAGSGPSEPGSQADVSVLAVDLYGTLVDPIAIFTRLEHNFGADESLLIAQLWRAKQMEYSFRVSMMDTYHDFRWVTSRALDFALASRGKTLSSDEHAALLAAYDELEPFPDVLDGLAQMQEAGWELTVLSNGSPTMIENCLQNSGLAKFMSSWLSVDEVKTFKPARLVYEWAAQSLGRSIGEVLLVSCNAFDVAGALSAGMSSAWLNRAQAPFDTITESPTIEVADFQELAKALSSTGSPTGTGNAGDR